jgi:hypothetical protein
LDLVSSKVIGDNNSEAGLLYEHEIESLAIIELSVHPHIQERKRKLLAVIPSFSASQNLS